MKGHMCMYAFLQNLAMKLESERLCLRTRFLNCLLNVNDIWLSMKTLCCFWKLLCHSSQLHKVTQDIYWPRSSQSQNSIRPFCEQNSSIKIPRSSQPQNSIRPSVSKIPASKFHQRTAPWRCLAFFQHSAGPWRKVMEKDTPEVIKHHRVSI